MGVPLPLGVCVEDVLLVPEWLSEDVPVTLLDPVTVLVPVVLSEGVPELVAVMLDVMEFVGDDVNVGVLLRVGVKLDEPVFDCEPVPDRLAVCEPVPDKLAVCEGV